MNEPVECDNCGEEAKVPIRGETPGMYCSSDCYAEAEESD